MTFITLDQVRTPHFERFIYYKSTRNKSFFKVIMLGVLKGGEIKPI